MDRTVITETFDSLFKNSGISLNGTSGYYLQQVRGLILGTNKVSFPSKIIYDDENHSLTVRAVINPTEGSRPWSAFGDLLYEFFTGTSEYSIWNRIGREFGKHIPWHNLVYNAYQVSEVRKYNADNPVVFGELQNNSGRSLVTSLPADLEKKLPLGILPVDNSFEKQ